MKDTFYKPIKIKGTPEDILFWGCVHHGHDPIHWVDPIWNQRGYSSGKACDDALIEKWNSKSNENTIGFLLGDTMFGNGGSDKLKNFLRRINFKEIYLCAGNHYAGFWQLLNEATDNIYILDEIKKVIFVPNYFELFVNGHPVVCGHYPLLSWNGQGKGSYMLHAHVHGRLKDSKVGKMFLESGAKALEVSVEVCPSPLTWNEIRTKLEKRESVSFDGHGPQTQNPF